MHPCNIVGSFFLSLPQFFFPTVKKIDGDNLVTLFWNRDGNLQGIWLKKRERSFFCPWEQIFESWNTNFIQVCVEFAHVYKPLLFQFWLSLFWPQPILILSQVWLFPILTSSFSPFYSGVILVYGQCVTNTRLAFSNFRASKLGDRHIFCSSGTSCWSSEIVKGFVW